MRRTKSRFNGFINCAFRLRAPRRAQTRFNIYEILITVLFVPHHTANAYASSKLVDFIPDVRRTVSKRPPVNRLQEIETAFCRNIHSGKIWFCHISLSSPVDQYYRHSQQYKLI